MANNKISALTELTTVADADQVAIVDATDTTETKRITRTNYVGTSTPAELNQLDGVTVGGSTSGDIATIDDTQTLTNKTINYSNNTITNLPTSSIGYNYVVNGDFINNSTNGYGGTADDWTDSSANPVQGGFPTMTKAELIALLGVTDGQIEGLWNLNEASGNATDLSSNSYDLTDTNTVTSSTDGLMNKARDFELSNSEYLTVADASCANLEIAGSQTWFAWIKPESIGAFLNVMAKFENSTGVQKSLAILTSNKPRISLAGLTTNATVSSDVTIEAGKWYFICGIYDSANTKLKIWVNGIKSEVTASGSATDSNADFAIGCNFNGGGDTAGSFFDGLIQNAGILSVALTDAQVKELWTATSYRKTKIRRGGSDGYIYQDLPQDLVARLRGQELTLRADIYQDTASITTVSIDDGVSEATGSALATTDAWVELSATRIIDADARQIRLKVNRITSDGDTWVKGVGFYHGAAAQPFVSSEEDWARYPRLLQMDPPVSVSGYEFEENRWFDWVPTYTGFAVDPTATTRYRVTGHVCKLYMTATATGTSNATTLTVTLPAKPVAISGTNSWQIPVVAVDNGAILATQWGKIRIVDATIAASVYTDPGTGAWTNSGGKYADFEGWYEV